MKPILFTRDDFEHIKVLIRLHSYIDETLREINLPHGFYNTYQNQMLIFHENYDKLYEKIKNTNKDLQYFSDDITHLGLKCFEILDNVGDMLDQTIQDFNLNKHFFNLHQDMFLDEIFY